MLAQHEEEAGPRPDVGRPHLAVDARRDPRHPLPPAARPWTAAREAIAKGPAERAPREDATGVAPVRGGAADIVDRPGAVRDLRPELLHGPGGQRGGPI